MTNPESAPVENPLDNAKKAPTPVPVGPDGMNDYIRRPKAEIQGESKSFLAKLRSDIDGLLHPKQSVTSTPNFGTPVNAPGEVGVSANNVAPGLPSGAGNVPPAGATVPEGRYNDVTSRPDIGAPVNAPGEIGVSANNVPPELPSGAGNVPPAGATVPAGRFPGF